MASSILRQSHMHEDIRVRVLAVEHMCLVTAYEHMSIVYSVRKNKKANLTVAARGEGVWWREREAVAPVVGRGHCRTRLEVAEVREPRATQRVQRHRRAPGRRSRAARRGRRRWVATSATDGRSAQKRAQVHPALAHLHLVSWREQNGQIAGTPDLRGEQVGARNEFSVEECYSWEGDASARRSAAPQDTAGKRCVARARDVLDGAEVRCPHCMSSNCENHIWIGEINNKSETKGINEILTKGIFRTNYKIIMNN